MKKYLFLISAVLFAACLGNSDKKERATHIEEDTLVQSELDELRQLAELDRQEMQQQYEDYAQQYDELKKDVRDPAMLEELNKAQQRAQELAEQLKQTQASDAAEIRRLKAELETVRNVLKSYIYQVDSLMQLNTTLTNERDEARSRLAEASSRIENLNTERSALSQKVAIAAQLDATNITITPVKKNNKTAKKVKDVVRFSVSFNIAKNVTAEAGNRSIYLRLLKPNQTVLNPVTKFSYEGRTLDASAAKTIEYDGQATSVQMYVASNEFLSPGSYVAQIFADGQMIGSTGVTLEK